MERLKQTYHILLLVVVLTCLLWGIQQTRDTTIQTLTPSLPHFHTHDCFLSNTLPREPWQPSVDGIIEMVGYHHYLVLYFLEADRRYAGPKEGWQEEMIAFDTTHHITTCPAGWVNH